MNDKIIQATVRIDGFGGRGVLVPGGFILTAAHCIKWNGEGAMALGDHFLESVTTKTGAKFRMTPWAVDLVSDIAVLGEADNQTFVKDAERFDKWRNQTAPVRLRTAIPAPRKPVSVRVLSHRGSWIRAVVTRWNLDPAFATITVEAEAPIKGGASGGPIVDSKGCLVGVVSYAVVGVKRGEKCTGATPLACTALPVWILSRINRAQRTKTVMSHDTE